MNSIKWIFFDVGSTLVDETDVYKSRAEFAVNAAGISMDEFMARVIEFEKTNATAIRTAAESYGVTLPPWNNKLEKLYPETPGALKGLAGKYKLGIIANQTAGTVQRLENWGIGKFFDVIVASEEAGCAKPDLKIFEMALQQAGCTPEDAIMVGDRLDNDIIPAKKLGMKTIWVRQAMSIYQVVDEKSQPDFTINSIGEINKIL